jgi:hypothetical protein
MPDRVYFFAHFKSASVRSTYSQSRAFAYCSDQIPRLFTRARPRRIQFGDGSLAFSSVMAHAAFVEGFGSCDRAAANLRLNESSRRLLYTDAMLYESMRVSSTSFNRLDLCGSRHRIMSAECPTYPRRCVPVTLRKVARKNA